MNTFAQHSALAHAAPCEAYERLAESKSSLQENVTEPKESEQVVENQKSTRKRRGLTQNHLRGYHEVDLSM